MSESDILKQALKLPVRKRERMAEALLGSVRRPSRSHIDALWVQEAEARVDALLQGRIKTIPGDQVLAYRGKR